MTEQEDCSFFVRDCELNVVQKSIYTSDTPSMAMIKNWIVELKQTIITINIISKEGWDVQEEEEEKENQTITEIMITQANHAQDLFHQ